MLFETRPPDDPELTALLTGAYAELVRRYGAEGRSHLHPRATCLVALLDGHAVACGAVQPTDTAGTGEIKRMYVAAEARRRGVARALLTELERVALGLGHTRLRLSTGEENAQAIALYTAAGFTRTEPYGKYVRQPTVHCYAKDIGPITGHEETFTHPEAASPR
ncbi:GNAT family N-acetyltransferase [Streptomyces avicenniae]|uniref:GNAT family N-acetyltransferase n=1 Tax=Streptomyces avicenniae TaxID=500153 RepID=UPI00167D13A0|nr:GNAT family N-acetyltransferase [Streptomyces avicenniae]